MATDQHQELKARVSAIVQKTYTEHGWRGRAWGMKELDAADDDLRCSYQAGCGIGISLSEDLAKEADEGQYTVSYLLRENLKVRQELLGTTEAPPEWVVKCLGRVQTEHDTHATASVEEKDEEEAIRASYRAAIWDIVTTYKLKIQPY